MANETRTDLANLACDLLGIDPIGDLNGDQSDIARKLRRNYTSAVQTILREYQWNCASRRGLFPAITLPADLTASAYGYTTAFPWPSECLRVIEIAGEDPNLFNWSNETIQTLDATGQPVSELRVIFANVEAPINLRYVIEIEPSQMDPHCFKACALELALRIEGLSKASGTRRQELKAELRQTIYGDGTRRGGAQVDSLENRRPKRVSLQPWQREHFGFDQLGRERD